MDTNPKRVGVLLAAAAVLLSACSNPQTEATPTRSTIEVVPGAVVDKASGTTEFQGLPKFSSITVTDDHDPSITRTHYRDDSEKVAQMLDELAVVLTAPHEKAEGQFGGCTYELRAVPKFLVTVDGHGQLFAPAIPQDRCGHPQEAARSLSWEFEALPGGEMVITN